MTCLFPELKPGRAYRRGCRCDLCKAHRQKSREDSRGKPFEERCIGVQKKYPVQAEPIVRMLEKWMDEIGNQTDVPFEVLGQELGIKTNSAMRMVYRLRNKETTYMSFSFADKLVSRLFGPQYWYEDPELLAIYKEHA